MVILLAIDQQQKKEIEREKERREMQRYEKREEEPMDY